MSIKNSHCVRKNFPYREIESNVLSLIFLLVRFPPSPCGRQLKTSLPKLVDNDDCADKKINFPNFLQITQFATHVDRKFLYFNVLNGDGNNKTITVEGGGVNATIIQSDIAATNGFVHIIDRVLGVPYKNVREKLATDPMLK